MEAASALRPRTTLKIAVHAPIPRVSVRIATAVKLGFLTIIRRL